MQTGSEQRLAGELSVCLFVRLSFYLSVGLWSGSAGIIESHLSTALPGTCLCCVFYSPVIRALVYMVQQSSPEPADSSDPQSSPIMIHDFEEAADPAHRIYLYSFDSSIVRKKSGRTAGQRVISILRLDIVLGSSILFVTT